MNRNRFLFLSLFVSLSLLIVAQSFASTNIALNIQQNSLSWQDKVDPLLLDALASSRAPDTTAEFLVIMDEQADLSGAADLTTKEEKGQYVYDQLRQLAQTSQAGAVADLEADGRSFRPYWINNMIWVEGDIDTVQTMASRDDVSYLAVNAEVDFDGPVSETADTAVNSGRAVQSIEWNITKINADDVWAAGYTGQGAVVGGQDTGYMWNHTTLINQYRGWDGTTESHDYNWHDAISANNGSCSGNSVEPCDDNQHGTHTMGTIVGNDLDPTDPSWPAGANNATGVAPGAEWIACRNMNAGNGTPASYTECYEWFIAPYPYGGDPMVDGDPSKAPHVINNSWACTTSEGCSTNTLLSVVQAVRAAGIVTVHSNGNSGSSCSTVHYPAANYDESFSVGSTTSSDIISGFSSRGPITADGSNRLKPDVTAPGQGVRAASKSSTTSYTTLSGTSMAGPHVAGLVALLISIEPTLAGQVDLIEHIIQETAVPLTSTQGCGGDGPTDVPNNVYGYGRIDAYAAMLYLQQLQAAPATLDSTTISPETVYQIGDSTTFTQSLTFTHIITNEQQIYSQTNTIITQTLPLDTIVLDATTPFTETEYAGAPQVIWPVDKIDNRAAAMLTLTVQITSTSNSTSTLVNNSLLFASDQTAETTEPLANTTVCGAPLPPSGLTITPTGNNALVSWSGSSDQYELWLSTDDPFFELDQTTSCSDHAGACITLNDSVTSYQFPVNTGIGSGYYYKVRSVSSCGAVSSTITNSTGTFNYSLFINGLMPFAYQLYGPFISR